jgi:hypothetical protein
VRKIQDLAVGSDGFGSVSSFVLRLGDEKSREIAFEQCNHLNNIYFLKMKPIKYSEIHIFLQCVMNNFLQRLQQTLRRREKHLNGAI